MELSFELLKTYLEKWFYFPTSFNCQMGKKIPTQIWSNQQCICLKQRSRLLVPKEWRFVWKRSSREWEPIRKRICDINNHHSSDQSRRHQKFCSIRSRTVSPPTDHNGDCRGGRVPESGVGGAPPHLRACLYDHQPPQGFRRLPWKESFVQLLHWHRRGGRRRPRLRHQRRLSLRPCGGQSAPAAWIFRSDRPR